MACEKPALLQLPLSRFSLAEVRNWLVEERVVECISLSTIWRWLHQAAIRPWFYRSWLFPRDPQFLEKAGRVLDLYQGSWEGAPLGPDDYVLSADEKTQLQILERRAATVAPRSGQPGRYENEYRRFGTLAYLAALDIGSGKIFGRMDAQVGIEPFSQLLELVMGQEPYASARRVFWIVDNGSSHMPTTFPKRLSSRYPNAIAVMLPYHASWLNQIEIYFSILQRKALTPNDLATAVAVCERVLGFQEHYNRSAQPFRWNFTKAALQERLDRFNQLSRCYRRTTYEFVY